MSRFDDQICKRKFVFENKQKQNISCNSWNSKLSIQSISRISNWVFAPFLGTQKWVVAPFLGTRSFVVSFLMKNTRSLEKIE